MKEYSINYSPSLLGNYRFGNVMYGGKLDLEGKTTNYFLQLIADTSNKKGSVLDFFKDKSPPWTNERIKEELYIELVSIKIDGERKYEKQASDLIYRVPVYHPAPNFIINERDLSKPLIKELSSLNHKERDKLIKDVISTLYESIDKDYFLLQIKKPGLIKWKIEE
jgi:hypothetical protein